MLEDVNNAPADNSADDANDEIMDAIAKKMIADLERATEQEGKESFRTARESNTVVDAVI